MYYMMLLGVFCNIYIYTWIFKRLIYFDPFGCLPIMVEIACFFFESSSKTETPKNHGNWIILNVS